MTKANINKGLLELHQNGDSLSIIRYYPFNLKGLLFLLIILLVFLYNSLLFGVLFILINILYFFLLKFYSNELIFDNGSLKKKYRLFRFIIREKLIVQHIDNCVISIEDRIGASRMNKVIYIYDEEGVEHELLSFGGAMFSDERLNDILNMFETFVEKKIPVKIVESNFKVSELMKDLFPKR